MWLCDVYRFLRRVFVAWSFCWRRVTRLRCFVHRPLCTSSYAELGCLLKKQENDWREYTCTWIQVRERRKNTIFEEIGKFYCLALCVFFGTISTYAWSWEESFSEMRPLWMPILSITFFLSLMHHTHQSRTLYKSSNGPLITSSLGSQHHNYLRSSPVWSKIKAMYCSSKILIYTISNSV